MLKKALDLLSKGKKKVSDKLVQIQADTIYNENKYSSRAGRRFLMGCMALAGMTAPAFAADTAAGGTTTASEVTKGIKDAMNILYGAMKTVGVVVAAVGVALAAFYLFTGGDKGMEKAKKVLLYTVIGCGILFLAVPIINFMADMFKNSSKDISTLNY